MKIAICVPCRDSVMSGFAFDLANMVGYVTRHTDHKITLLQMPGTLIFTQREKLAEEALADGAEAILWIDSDMRFPANTLEVMLSRKVPILGVNATTRREPIIPTAGQLEMKDGLATFRKVESRGKQGIEQVTAVGFGVTLVKSQVFREIPKPWFNIIWKDDGDIIGEDVHFCVKALDFGIETYVDHDLSPLIKHIGTKEYGWDDVKHGNNNIQRPAKHNRKLSRKK